MWTEALFKDWAGLGRTLFVGALAYVALVALLRISGKRTLSKMNAFDFVVTVALGSTLATIMLSKDVALAEGVAAFATLIGLQFAISWLSVRSSTVSDLVNPVCGFWDQGRGAAYHGRCLEPTRGGAPWTWTR